MSGLRASDMFGEEDGHVCVYTLDGDVYAWDSVSLQVLQNIAQYDEPGSVKEDDVDDFS